MPVPKPTPANVQTQATNPVMRSAQSALAEILVTPSLELLAVIQRQMGSSDPGEIFRVATLAKTLIGDRIGGLRKDTGDEVSPTKVERHSFAWEVLRQARIQLRRIKKGVLPATASIDDARAAFSGVLGSELHDDVLLALLKLLDIGPAAEHLTAYWAFLKSPGPLPQDIDTEQERVRRLLRWVLLSQKEQYVEVTAEGQVVVHFPYVASVLLSELRKLAPQLPAESLVVKTQVENVINDWLDYSGLSDLTFNDSEEHGQSLTAAAPQEIARAFIKFNDLNKRIVFRPRSSDGAVDKRVAELETLVRQYALENRALEETIQELRRNATPLVQAPPETQSPTQPGTDLRDFIRLVDSKYSLDALNGIQLGEETPLTLKSFVAHLFYALRKRGLAPYPDADLVTISYEQSGLYECVGFEVSPGESVAATVINRGWALRTQNRLLPVRRATVKRTGQNS